jgi:hypothetical protein
MSAPIAKLSNLVFARHSFSAAGSVIHIHDLAAASPTPETYRYGDAAEGGAIVENFFVHSLGHNLVILAVFLAAFFGATYAILALRRPG